MEGFARKLGMLYSKLKDRVLDGYRLVKMTEVGHSKVIKWRIRKIEDDTEGPPELALNDAT
jgi:hypothetical protein